jgi:hypothetical protein
MGAAPRRKDAARTSGAEMAQFHTFGIGWDRTSAPIASTPASTPRTDSVNRMPFSGVVSRPFSIRKSLRGAAAKPQLPSTRTRTPMPIDFSSRSSGLRSSW